VSDNAEVRLLEGARAGDGGAFEALTEPYRRELQLHCYRILGSVHDAEDLLQETLLAAWCGLDGFEGRASLRAWLYRIATNRCLNALRKRPPLALASAPPCPPEPTRRDEPLRLDPYPDALLEGVPDAAPGPEARYEQREGVALAFVAGLQRLPERQRVVLVLRDVLGYRASEVGEMIGASAGSVDSALKRARAALEERHPAARERAPLPASREERELVERYVEAQERGDIDAAVALLSDDAWLTMPPWPAAYQGPTAIAAFFRTVAGDEPAAYSALLTRANGQPAIAWYLGGRPNVVEVLTLAGGSISATTVFTEPDVFAHFGLPQQLGD
jgi:RNA polymerase sigma-70 factor (TIGR02960 family)